MTNPGIDLCQRPSHMLVGRRVHAVLFGVLAAATLLSAVACRSGGEERSTRPGEGSALTDLNDTKSLQARFNQDEGVPRLLLILSPT